MQPPKMFCLGRRHQLQLCPAASILPLLLLFSVCHGWVCGTGAGTAPSQQTYLGSTPGLLETTLEESEPPCPCSLTPDQTYVGGEFLDCSNRDLQNFSPEWATANTTTIHLDNNRLQDLPGNCFDNVVSLKRLYLSGNQFQFLQKRWFQNLENLVLLDLESNQLNLDKTVLPPQVFASLPSLNQLYLANNGNEQREGEYPDRLFSSLPQLKVLSFDTFAEDLDFATVFDNLTSPLTSLRLTGGARRILNSSFQAFHTIPLQTLTLNHLYLLQDTQPGAFEPLHSLTSLQFDDTRQTMGKTFLSLKPFVGRNVTQMVFNRIGYTKKQMGSYTGNKIISKSISKYLRDICVERLAVMSSGVTFLENESLRSKTFARCLKILDLRGNPLRGDYDSIYTFVHYTQLRSLILSGSPFKQPSWPSCPNISTNTIQSGDNSKTSSHFKREHVTREDQDKRKVIPYPISREPTWISERKGLPVKGTNVSRSLNPYNVNRSRFGLGKGVVYISLPRNLEQLYVHALSDNMFPLQVEVNFFPNKLKEFYISDNGIKDVTGQIKGLDKLKILDISRNNGSMMRHLFFDYFSSLKVLLMQETRLDPYFITIFSSRLFRNLTNLQTLDLSNNGLNLFSEGTFKTTKLEVLILARNRFQSIPFSIKNAPYLCHLDLRFNSIPGLTGQEMAELDDHHRRQGRPFSIFLEGNVFSCSCSNFDFLRWLTTTNISLDNHGNYTCLASNGQLTYTHAFTDIQAFWRECVGETAMFISIILLSTMVTVFILAILLFNFRTRLQAYFHQVILRTVKSKKPSDYDIGVYIAYSSQDASFACLSLNSFIENDLQLSTFVRDRDAMANGYQDMTIMNAVDQSWRVLLVVTRAYLLDDPWSFYTMKLASSCVSLTNQRRLVLLVQEGLAHRLPMTLLHAVREESVISLAAGAGAWEGVVGHDQIQRQRTSSLELTPQLRHSLRQALLPQQ